MATASEKTTLKRLEKEAAEYRKMIEGLEHDKLKREQTGKKKTTKKTADYHKMIEGLESDKKKREEEERKKAAAPKKRKTRKVIFPTKNDVSPDAYEREFGPRRKPKPIKPTVAKASPNAYEKEFGFGCRK